MSDQWQPPPPPKPAELPFGPEVQQLAYSLAMDVLELMDARREKGAPREALERLARRRGLRPELAARVVDMMVSAKQLIEVLRLEGSGPQRLIFLAPAMMAKAEHDPVKPRQPGETREHHRERFLDAMAKRR